MRVVNQYRLKNSNRSVKRSKQLPLQDENIQNTGLGFYAKNEHKPPVLPVVLIWIYISV